MAKTVLVINSGSSSIKYQLVDLETGEGLASGLVEKIGEPVDGHYKHEYQDNKHELEEQIPELYLKWLNTSADWLDGKTPGEYFAAYTDANELVDMLRAYNA